MAGEKYYLYKGEPDEETEEILRAMGLRNSPLYVDTFGQLYAQEEQDESEFHPDDKNAARIHYQSLGIEV